MEEQELTELCRQGNNRARKELYEQYSGRMLASVSGMPETGTQHKTWYMTVS